MSEIDPIIVWPNHAQLAPIIGEMQRLNPSLNLRCATTFWPAREEQYRTANRNELLTRTVGPCTSEYLAYDGTAFDLFKLAMPEPQSDAMMSGLTEVNREGYTARTDIGRFRIGPRRIERTADGGLLVRPQAGNAEAAADRFNLAWQGFFDGDQRVMAKHIGRFVARWGIFQEEWEMWEVEMAYLPEFFAIETRRPMGDHAFWHTTPVGTISYIDQFDLPIEDHYARARAIVSAGSEFAIVGDVERGEVRVFRTSGVETYTDDFRLPEMPWFHVPIGRGKEDGVW